MWSVVLWYCDFQNKKLLSQRVTRTDNRTVFYFFLSLQPTMVLLLTRNQKLELGTPLKFNFAYWLAFSAQFVECEKELRACLILSFVQISSIQPQIHPFLETFFCRSSLFIWHCLTSLFEGGSVMVSGRISSKYKIYPPRLLKLDF